MVKYALLARVEAKPGKEDEGERFLKSALPLARAASATRAWYAWKIHARTFGIFDTFEDEAGRQAHLSGEIAKALTANVQALLARPPVIERLDVLAAKQST